MKFNKRNAYLWLMLAPTLSVISVLVFKENAMIVSGITGFVLGFAAPIFEPENKK